MLSSPAWITKLKASELHKVAVRIGTPCSGTKAIQLEGIRNALSSLPIYESRGASRSSISDNGISLISIDMGIRNLAYSHWTASLTHSTSKGPRQYDLPALQAWRKIDISSKTAALSSSESAKPMRHNDVAETASVKETFEPSDYASRAYELVSKMVEEYKPTHVLIERQRFRSGGNSAVLEWTIRVGVFEGMLYAVLKSLAAERKDHANLRVEPMLPARVNRYWLERHSADPGELKAVSIRKGREVKEAKIELVRQLLLDVTSGSNDRAFEANDSVANLVSAFLPNCTDMSERATSRKRETSSTKQTAKISKLDDLSDCLLQGLAWFRWQNNRLRLRSSDSEVILR